MPFSCRPSRRVAYGEFARLGNGYEHIQIVFTRLDPGDVQRENPDRVAIELLAPGFATVDIKQARYAMSLQAAMER